MIWSRSRGWIGVDIGTSAVKIVQVERQGLEYQLASALIIRRQEPWECATDDLAVQSSEQELCIAMNSDRPFRGRSAAVVLPMCTCDVNEWGLAEAQVHAPAQLVSEQLATIHGAAANQREFGFWQTSGTRSGQAVIAISTPRTWSRQVVRDLGAARLEARVLDTLPLTLARAVSMVDPARTGEPVLALDWGYRRSTLCAVANGAPQFVRSLPEAEFSQIVDAVGDSLALKRDEVQKLLVEKGLPSSESYDELSNALGEVAAPMVARFAEEVSRTLSFLQQQRQFIPRKVVLFGGGATVKNIVPHLQEKLGLPVSRWRINARQDFSGRWPVPRELLGPAVALSTLCWEKSG